MTYEQTVHYLFTRLPMFSRIGAAAIRKDLTNTIELCRHLDNPQSRFKSIHVAGTNGKGSTSHMLAAVLQTAGYKTGLYTSPHIKDFGERIRINGKMIDEDFVIAFVEKIQPQIDAVDPSFFEISVAMAFDYFAQQQVDIAVVEVGLGGRLDSTNIIVPELSVITNIGYDHMNLLGDSLPEIATEKGGIIKSNAPVVIGETHVETTGVFERIANQRNAPIVFADKELYVAEWKHEKNQLIASVAYLHGERTTYHLDLTGYYQIKNLVTVLETIRQLELKGWRISREHIAKGLANVKKLTDLHGRWEVIHQNPLIVLDVAHNEAGMQQVAAQLELSDHRHLHIVIGVVKDKDAAKMLSLLPKEATYYFTRADIPRALPETELAEIGRGQGLSGAVYASVEKALHAAFVHAETKDLILVCGSVFTVAEVDLSALHAAKIV